MRAIEDWLERERERRLAAAIAVGVGPQVDADVVVVRDVTETGWSTETVRRKVNPYSVRGMMWAIVADSTEPAGSKELAQLLYATYGERAHVPASGFYPALFATQPTDWIDKVLLSQAAYRYVCALSSLSEPVGEELRRTADDLVRLMETDTIVAATLLPVAGLRASSRLEVGPAVLRPMTDNELGELFAASSPQMLGGSRLWLRPLEPGFGSERVILEARDEHPKAELYPRFTLMPRIVLGLQLLGFEPHGRGFSATAYEPLPLSGTLGSIVPLSQHGTWREVTERDLAEAVALARLIPVEALGGSEERAHIAIARFRTAVTEPVPPDALIDYVIALEAILLPPAHEGELRFRFSLYGAYYLGRDRNERVDLFRQFQDVYNARSTVVHGVSAPQVADVATTARRLAAAVLVKALRSGWPTQESLRAAAFG